MTPKEKAKELVKHFMKIGMIGFELKARQQKAKQCALICVDEILLSQVKYCEVGKWVEFEKYWNEVKQEINKL